MHTLCASFSARVLVELLQSFAMKHDRLLFMHQGRADLGHYLQYLSAVSQQCHVLLCVATTVFAWPPGEVHWQFVLLYSFQPLEWHRFNSIEYDTESDGRSTRKKLLVPESSTCSTLYVQDSQWMPEVPISYIIFKNRTNEKTNLFPGKNKIL